MLIFPANVISTFHYLDYQRGTRTGPGPAYR